MLGAALALSLCAQVPSPVLAKPVAAAFVCAALLLAGGAVSRRLQTSSQDPEDRVTSAAIVSLAGLVALLGYAATPSSWDSVRMLLAVLTVVALFGSVLVLLPRVPRRIIASAIVLFHFAGIATAVTSVAPANEPAPWLSTQLWLRVFRPYLQFMYLTNAYHFYSPNPGPPSLNWFRVRYSDGTSRWIKLPVREESPVGLQYQRMLALAESSNNPLSRPPLTKAEIEELKKRDPNNEYDREPWETIVERRTVGGGLYSPPLYRPADMAPEAQYNEPSDYAKRLIQSYARHIARTSPHPTNPNAKVVDVRVYRVIHQIIRPFDYARGISPLVPTLYTPTYVGKFDTDGNLLDGSPITSKNSGPPDPFLYWYVPMVIVPKNYGERGETVPLLFNHQPSLEEGKILNGVEIHSGDAPGAWQEEPINP
jgi:hypothetical protein